MGETRSKMNKKAQFFIIGAVILGIIILSLATTWNVIINSREETAQKQFDLWCQNYEYEIFKISEHAIKTNNKNNEADLILDFTTNFIDYVKNSDPNFGIVYIYGDNSNIIIFNSTNHEINSPGVTWTPENGYCLGEITGTITNIEIEIGDTNINKEYKISEDKGFWFVALTEKDGEQYVCE